MNDKLISEYMSKINNRRKIDISNLSKHEIYDLVLSLPDNEELHFFDYFHPQWSDPGAYVIIMKYNGKYIYKLGNHGWGSDWHNVDIHRLCRYIYKNRNHQEEPLCIHEIINELKLKDDEPSSEMFWEDKLNLVYKDDGLFYLYEVNGYHIIHISKTNETYAINEELEEKLEKDAYSPIDIFNEFIRNLDSYKDRRVIIKLKK